MPKDTDPIEEKSYTKLFFILASLFFLVSVWAFYDEFVSRRSWKEYQREFNTLELTHLQEEYQKAKQALEIEDAGRDQIPEASVDADLSLRRIRLRQEQAEINMESGEYQKLARELKERQIRLSDAKQRTTFAKADQGEFYYEWKRMEGEGKETASRFKEKYYDLAEKMVGLKKNVEDAEAAVAEIQGKMDRYKEELKKWQVAEKQALEPLTQLEKKMEAVRSRGLDIKQVVVEDLGRGGAVHWGAVDRCESCHVAINRDGFENEKNPFKTHPFRKEIFGKHPIEQYGCTTCHAGQGRATQIKGKPLEEGDFVHGFVHHWTEPLLTGDFLQSSCNKCHQDQWKLDYAPAYLAGKKLFWGLGCTGCHAVKGFETAPKVGPSLSKIKDKVYPEWLVSWIKNPRDYLPHTKMPKPPLDLETSELSEEERLHTETNQIEKVAAYLFQASEPYDFPLGRYPGGNAEQGRRTFETVGCLGCHTLGDKGTGLAAALDKIASKTSADWIYNWIQNPKTYNPEARMPNLRLTSQEAADVTAFLSNQGRANPHDASPYDDPENAKQGYLIISQIGCYGCHNIKGFETASKLSVDLSDFGKKETDLMDFGDTKVPHTWKDWTQGKLQNPRTYLTEKTSSKMPNFGLTEEQIHQLLVFLQGLKNEAVPERYQMSLRPHQKEIDEGRRLVQRLNCRGCHLIEGEGRLIEAFLADPAKAPPILDGIGARVRPEWMFEFLKNPGRVKIRPWIDVRMPTFGFSDVAANTVIHYFASLAGVRSDFYSPTAPPALSPEIRAAAEKLVSSNYFSCFSCHIRGSVTPASAPQQWGPDLTMVRERIRPEFLPEWLKDPQKFTPGVNMPAFLPDDSAAPQDILDGNSQRQAEAIRDYLLNLSR